VPARNGPAVVATTIARVPLRVVFIAAECEPLAKTGGLADVVDALARALGRLPTDELVRPVDVFLPRYRGLPHGNARIVRVTDPMAASGASDISIGDLDADGYRLRLVDHPPAFDRPHLYGDPALGDDPDNAWRFGLFGRAILEALRQDGRPVDVLHAHDWHSCPAIVARDRWYARDPVLGRAASLLTVHNPAYHGWVPRNDVWQLGLAAGDGILDADAAGIDLLWTGVARADLVNTVSPGFADEVRTPALGFGLDGPFRARGDRFFGILNGLDEQVWDPATDPALPARYNRHDRTGKIACRADLLARVGFDVGDPAPVLGMVGRLDPQKGFDILAAATPALLGLGARLIVLGSGDPSAATGLRALADARPDRITLIEAFDRELARRTYAGCDLFLMPSRFEPCGQAQMIALRYGTPPVVHATGGLRDTVVDEYDRPGEGTGWAFRHSTPDGLVWACEQAIAVYREGGERWEGVVGRGMAVEFDWLSGPAPRYLEAYRRAVSLRRGGGPVPPLEP
jgi:starch synthase